MTVAVKYGSEGTFWMPPRREAMVTYSVRVPDSLDKRITAMRLHTLESAAAYAVRAIKAQLERDEAELNAQGIGEGETEKR